MTGITGPTLRKTFLISILGHIAIFSIFSVSSGTRLPTANYAGISFRGALLSRYDFVNRNIAQITRPFFRKINTPVPEKEGMDISILPYHLKPQAGSVFSQDKKIAVQAATATLTASPKKESVVMFYPPLPYHFLLYFKDRQAVHIELMFNVLPDRKSNSMDIKRKISSGNLEVDLLTMRYLSHYLFIQQAGFPANKWQTVKIELSPKND